MLRSKQPKASASGELMPPLSVLDRIDWNLKDQLLAFPSKGQLEPEEIEHWHQDLGRFPIRAIDAAFDNWRKNGRFFPHYGAILDQCIAWQPADKSEYAPGCSKECRSRHGRGYNQFDMLKMFKMYVAKRTEVDRLVNNQEVLALFDELDKLRGRAPEWRKKPA